MILSRSGRNTEVSFDEAASSASGSMSLCRAAARGRGHIHPLTSVRRDGGNLRPMATWAKRDRDRNGTSIPSTRSISRRAGENPQDLYTTVGCAALQTSPCRLSIRPPPPLRVIAPGKVFFLPRTRMPRTRHVFNRSKVCLSSGIRSAIARETVAEFLRRMFGQTRTASGPLTFRAKNRAPG